MSSRISQSLFTWLSALLLLVFITDTSAQAEVTRKVRKSTTTVIQSDTEGDNEEEVLESQSGSKKEVGLKSSVQTERELTSTFGPKSQTGMAGCKTEDLKTEFVKDLKLECKDWIKEQRADLKDKYVTSSCEEQCSDCGMNLSRCFVQGKIRYILK